MSTTTLHLLDTFFQHHKPSHYKKRTMILQANDSSSSVFYIKSGYLRVFRISEQGEELTLTILKPRDFFPLTYGITHFNNPYYLEAMTAMDLWKVPAEHFVRFIRNNPQVYFDLTDRVLVRFDGFLMRMEYMVFSNAYKKVAAAILTCAKRFGEPFGDTIIINIPLTHKDIATLIGITRETTSLEMKKLENNNLITRNGRFLVIRNLKALEESVLTIHDVDSPLVNSF